MVQQAKKRIDTVNKASLMFNKQPNFIRKYLGNKVSLDDEEQFRVQLGT